MGLMACPECRASVSERAESCPRCGCPIGRAREAERPGRFWKGAQTVGVVGFLFGLVALFFVGPRLHGIAWTVAANAVLALGVFAGAATVAVWGDRG